MSRQTIDFERVFADELAHIRDASAQRPEHSQDRQSEAQAGAQAEAQAGAQADAPEDASAPRDDIPSTHHGLAGLAFSGGGIRSATFNLGILMGLRRAGLLRHFDYLSTVSGGGYIGSCLSNMVRQDKVSELLGAAPGDQANAGEGRMLRHLRNHSNYLVTEGLASWARIIGLLFKGILVNLFLLTSPILLLAGVCALATIWHQSPAGPRPFILTASLIGLLVLGALLSPWLLQLGGRSWRSGLAALASRLMLAIPIVAFIEWQPLLLSWTYHWSAQELGGWSSGLLAAALFGSTQVGNLAKKLSGVGAIVGILAAAVLGILMPFFLYLPAATLAAFPPDFIPGPPWTLAAGYIAFAVLLFGLLSTMDINTTTLHAFNRDLLASAFLVNMDTGTTAHELRLSELPRRPYHLINATVNLQGSSDPDLRQRSCDFLVFSPLYVGSERMGSVATRDLEALVPDFTVASAVAISGAAVAPNMGTYTNRALVLLMGLLNVRMGYWLPNPARFGRRRPGIGFFYRELTSAVHERSSFINVSDGGHLENEGVYQLLRRRCRFIVLGDGAADPRSAFDSLADLVRMARIDLDVDIDIDLSALRPVGGLGRERSAVGVIRYPAAAGRPPEVGYLLYLRATLTGSEDVVVASYQCAHPDFPHQSTGDQFFDEAQFEAYRALGEQTVRELLNRHAPGRDSSRPMSHLEFQAMFPALGVLLTPRSRDTATLSAREQLQHIEHALSVRDAWPYFLELYPETPVTTRPAVDPMDTPRYQMLSASMLALIEQVLEDAGLDHPEMAAREANVGWLNLFQRWACANTFRRSWLHLAPSFSPRLQLFGRLHLGLQDLLSWRDHRLDDSAPGPTDIPKNYVPPALLPEPALLARWPEARRLRLAYSIALKPKDARRGRQEEHPRYHTVIIGYALVNASGTLVWMALRTGYRGINMWQRAIASLNVFHPGLKIAEDVIPELIRSRVAAELCVLEDIDAEPLRQAFERWHEASSHQTGFAAQSEELQDLQPTAFVYPYSDDD